MNTSPAPTPSLTPSPALAARAAAMFEDVADDIRQRTVCRALFLSVLAIGIPVLTPLLMAPKEFFEYWYVAAAAVVAVGGLMVLYVVSDRRTKLPRARRNLVEGVGVFFCEATLQGRLFVVGDKGLYVSGDRNDQARAVFGLDALLVELTVRPSATGAVDVRLRYAASRDFYRGNQGLENVDVDPVTFTSDAYVRLEAAIRAYGALDPFWELRIARIPEGTCWEADYDVEPEVVYTSRPKAERSRKLLGAMQAVNDIVSSLRP